MPKLFIIKKLLKQEADHNKSTLDDIKYFNDLSNDEINKLMISKLIACDCNMKNLLYMTDVDENIYRYTFFQYCRELQCNKTNNILKIANDIENEELYYKALWREHLNKKRSAEKMITNIKHKYGNNIVIIIGDLCSNGNQTDIFQWLLTILIENFTVYKADEYKTTMINCRTYEKNNSVNVIGKKGKKIKLNAVLSYVCKDGSNGYINRDRNASINILYIVMYWIELFEFLYKQKDISLCNLIKNDERLQNFIKYNNLSENKIKKYLQKNGRPIQFM